MTDAPTTHNFTCCLDEDCNARTSQGWMTCASRRLNEDFIFEDAHRAARRANLGFAPRVAEVFNDPTALAFHAARRTR